MDLLLASPQASPGVSPRGRMPMPSHNLASPQPSPPHSPRPGFSAPSSMAPSSIAQSSVDDLDVQIRQKEEELQALYKMRQLSIGDSRSSVPLSLSPSPPASSSPMGALHSPAASPARVVHSLMEPPTMRDLSASNQLHSIAPGGNRAAAAAAANSLHSISPAAAAHFHNAASEQLHSIGPGEVHALPPPPAPPSRPGTQQDLMYNMSEEDEDLNTELRVLAMVKHTSEEGEIVDDTEEEFSIALPADWVDFNTELANAIGWEATEEGEEFPHTYYFNLDGVEILLASETCYNEMMFLCENYHLPETTEPWRVLVVLNETAFHPGLVAIPPHKGNNLASPWKQGKQLGQGAFGSVWMALKSDGTLCAVKILDTDQAGGHITDSFLVESQLLQRLEHPNVVSYISAKTLKHSAMIWMEYVPGGSVAQLLQVFGAIAEHTARKFVRNILEGLVYLHDNKVIHRDLKPGNILIETAGVAKISDFGASLSKSASFNDAAAKGPCMQGTPNYIAPEVVRAKKPEDFSYNVDIWSLGMTVIEMFTAKMPFKDDFSNPSAMIFKIGRLKEPPAIPSSTSKVASAFLRDCLIVDKTKRPGAREMLQHEFVRIGHGGFTPAGRHGRPDELAHVELTGDDLFQEDRANTDVSNASTWEGAGENEGLGLLKSVLGKPPLSGVEKPNEALLDMPPMSVKKKKKEKEEGKEEGKKREKEEAKAKKTGPGKGGKEKEEERRTKKTEEEEEEEEEEDDDEEEEFQWRYFHHENWLLYDATVAAQLEKAYLAKQEYLLCKIKTGEEWTVYEMTLQPEGEMRQRQVKSGYERRIARQTEAYFTAWRNGNTEHRRRSEMIKLETMAIPTQEQDLSAYLQSKVSIEEAAAQDLIQLLQFEQQEAQDVPSGGRTGRLSSMSGDRRLSSMQQSGAQGQHEVHSSGSVSVAGSGSASAATLSSRSRFHRPQSTADTTAGQRTLASSSRSRSPSWQMLGGGSAGRGGSAWHSSRHTQSLKNMFHSHSARGSDKNVTHSLLPGVSGERDRFFGATVTPGAAAVTGGSTSTAAPSSPLAAAAAAASASAIRASFRRRGSDPHSGLYSHLPTPARFASIAGPFASLHKPQPPPSLDLEEALVPAQAVEKGASHAGWTVIAKLEVGNVFNHTGPVSTHSITRAHADSPAAPTTRTVTGQSWTAYVRPHEDYSLAQLITKVEFDLSPDNPATKGTVEINSEPFEVSRWSLHSFDIAITLHLTSKKKFTVRHWLCLSKSGGWSTIKNSTQDDSFPTTYYVICTPPGVRPLDRTGSAERAHSTAANMPSHVAGF